MSPSDGDQPDNGPRKAFNDAAPRTGHLSKKFNEQAKVQPATYSRDIRKNRPTGPGFGPQGQKKAHKPSAKDYHHEQGRMKNARENSDKVLSLKDKFNDKARGR